MNIPKLRFKDNNGNDYPQWEKKKLGDIVQFLDKAMSQQTVDK